MASWMACMRSSTTVSDTLALSLPRLIFTTHWSAFFADDGNTLTRICTVSPPFFFEPGPCPPDAAPTAASALIRASPFFTARSYPRDIITRANSTMHLSTDSVHSIVSLAASSAAAAAAALSFRSPPNDALLVGAAPTAAAADDDVMFAVDALFATAEDIDSANDDVDAAADDADIIVVFAPALCTDNIDSVTLCAFVPSPFTEETSATVPRRPNRVLSRIFPNPLVVVCARFTICGAPSSKFPDVDVTIPVLFPPATLAAAAAA
mmetsp:Transcript_15701/g.33935  ORF Transcript_15701/g.33935 Transcript_15701/m.33935 type:complete len:265 (+) Transcript_15701:727-1521(+)